MASNLYEILGLDRNASPQDVRKAYRRRALETHPDRVPAGTTEEGRIAAAEQFRQVNNAYEVLNDPSNRELYDRAGVWPPDRPEEPRRSSTRHGDTFTNGAFFDPFPHSPFFNFGPGSGNRGFAFTDPFELFNSMFGDINALHSHFDDDGPFFGDLNRMQPRMMSPFGGLLFGSGFGPGFGAGPGFGSPRPDFTNQSRMTAFGGANSSGRWVSQSQMTRTINGRTETVLTQRDAQGNEHVHYKSPEGERYTINGVEQRPEQQAITNGSQPVRPQPPPISAPPPQGMEQQRESVPIQDDFGRSSEKHHRSTSHHSHSSHHGHNSPRPHDPYPHDRPREERSRADYYNPDLQRPSRSTHSHSHPHSHHSHSVRSSHSPAYPQPPPYTSNAPSRPQPPVYGDTRDRDRDQGRYDSKGKWRPNGW